MRTKYHYKNKQKRNKTQRKKRGQRSAASSQPYRAAEASFGGTKKVKTIFSKSFLDDKKMVDNTYIFNDNQPMGCTFRKYLNDMYLDVEEYLAALKADKTTVKQKYSEAKLQGYDIIRG
jgi:hypothetical protein